MLHSHPVFDALLSGTKALSVALGFRDQATQQHADRVVGLSQALGHACQLTLAELSLLRVAATFHDVGKIGIPDRILQKPGTLTAEEFEIIKQHPIIGAQIFFDSAHPYHIASGIVALTHHERYNGSGYPRGLAGEEIHLFGRIVAVADVYDALTTPRVYKEQWPEEKAIALLESESGHHFDPKIAACFIDSLPQIREAGKRIEIEEAERRRSLDLSTLLSRIPVNNEIDDSEEYPQ